MEVGSTTIAAAREPGLRNPKEVFQQFETLFAKELVSQMKVTIGGDGVFGKGPGADIYEGFFESTFAEILAEKGSLGIADMMSRTYARSMAATEDKGVESDEA